MELAQEVGLQPKWAASTEGGEYKSSCPQCGGNDRFSIQPNKQMNNCLGRYYCRQCGAGGNSINFARKFLGMSFQDAVVRTNASIEGKKSFSFMPKKRMVTPVSIISPSLLWKSKATSFARWAHQNIRSNQEVLEWLRVRGLSKEAVQKYQIGWCPYDIWREKAAWGIESNNEKKLWIPRGIVIPVFDKKGNVIRLKIRRDNYKDGDEFGKYIVVSGSMNGLNIIGDTRHKIMLVTEAELDAYACDYAAGDIVCAIAVGNNIKTPDEATNYHANAKEHLLICHDNDEAGKSMLRKWQSLYGHAQPFPTPLGKDIGEAISLGLDVRGWILMRGWMNSPDKPLIEWVLNYINARTTTRESYVCFEKEIALGAHSPRAVSGELQEGLRLMQKLVN